MLDIKELSYRINTTQVLNNLSLTINPGQYYALAGENGAGKTTLIKIVLDLIRNIESGYIKIDEVKNTAIESRRRLSYLPEKFDIKKDVKGWQYLKFVCGVYEHRFNGDRIEHLCERLSLDYNRLDDRANNYSKGMKQKLGLISCFMLDKPLIILDEPLSGLDPKARYLFKSLLQDERKNNRTVFYSTHMLADAEEICDQFGILHQGKIVFNGTPQQCLQQFQANSLEKAYMNCISGDE